MLGAALRPARGKTVNQRAQPLAFFRQVPFIRHNKTLRRRSIAAPIGASSFSTFDFTSGPTIRPMNIRGSLRSPTAHSIVIAQCAIACAAFILPQCRTLVDPSRPIRSFTWFAVAVSNRFFISSTCSSQPVTTQFTRRSPRRILARGAPLGLKEVR